MSGNLASKAYLSDSGGWRTLTTEHFVFHFRDDSAAERNVMLVKGRLDAVREATIRLLALPHVADTPIHVDLLETQDDEIVPDGPDSRDADKPVAGRVRAVYRDDAPGEALQRVLVALLLAESLGEQAARSPLIVDGVLGFVTQQIDEPRRSSRKQALNEPLRQGDPISLAALIEGPPAPGDPLYFRAVTAFVTFLVITYGADRFRRFAQVFDAGDPNRAVERAFGKPPAVLEKEWLNTLREPPLGLMGIGGLLRTLLRLMRPHWGLALLIVLALAPVIAFKAGSPLLFKAIIDDGLIGKNHHLLTLSIVVLFALMVAKVAGLVAREYVVAQFAALISNDLRLKVLDHLQRLSHDFYARAQVGDLVSRLSSDLDAIENALGQALPVCLQMVGISAVALVLLFTQDWKLALTIFVLIPLLYFDFRLIGPRTAQASFQRQRDAAQALSTVEEFVLARPAVVAFGLNERILSRFKGQLAALVGSTVRVGLLSGILGLSVIGGGALLIALVISIGAIMVLHGHLTVGD